MKVFQLRCVSERVGSRNVSVQPTMLLGPLWSPPRRAAKLKRAATCLKQPILGNCDSVTSPQSLLLSEATSTGAVCVIGVRLCDERNDTQMLKPQTETLTGGHIILLVRFISSFVFIGRSFTWSVWVNITSLNTNTPLDN